MNIFVADFLRFLISGDTVESGSSLKTVSSFIYSRIGSGAFASQFLVFFMFYMVLGNLFAILTSVILYVPSSYTYLVQADFLGSLALIRMLILA